MIAGLARKRSLSPGAANMLFGKEALLVCDLRISVVASTLVLPEARSTLHIQEQGRSLFDNFLQNLLGSSHFAQ